MKPPKAFIRSISLPGQIALVGMMLAALWLGGLHAFTRPLSDVPVTPREQADAIVVLTGGSNRLQTGFDLLEKGLGKKLFISGVYQGVDVRELLRLMHPEKAAVTEDPDSLLDETGLSDRVVLGFEASDTIGNARETVAWLRQQGYRRFYLVTANYHLKRAALEFKLIAPDLSAIPLPVTPEGLDMDNWWRNKTHRSLIIREYMKYLLAQARGLVIVKPA